jgi:hypothetical protein
MSQKPIIPEVVVDEGVIPRDLVLLRQFAVLMDEAVAIPGTRKRIGLDAAIGLVPGIGDAVGAVLSLWILVGAVRHRVPGRIIAKMLWNVFIDMTVGMIPIAGDLFDLLFRENVRNVELLIRNRDRRRRPMNAAEIGLVAAAFFGIIVIGIIMSFVALFVGLIWLIGALRS